ncbi:MAG: hypothetical protein J2P13_00595 [Acidobacteria bacterium]|nr:hypothetical protein [Acidobacteriota bacterium]
MRPRSVSFSRAVGYLAALLVSAAAALPAFPQQAPPRRADDQELANSIQELRSEIEQLRGAVSELRSEADQYRAENQQLRKELEGIRASAQPTRPQEPASAGQPGSRPDSAGEQSVSSIEDTTQVQQSQLRTLYQTKVESASKYRLRVSGLVLLNLFRNNGGVDDQDVPTYATRAAPYGASPTFGATLRQSEIGLEVFGPSLGGAKTSGQVYFDFGGGFPNAVQDGVNTGLVRLRTGDVRLDWENTSVVAGQDNLFISPNSPTSFASLLEPSLSYSGNLWAWTPQLRVERRFRFARSQAIAIQGAILDNLTGELSYGTLRVPSAGESSGQPAYAMRTYWQDNVNERPLILGVSGYYSRQNWGYGRNVDGWAGIADLRIPLPARFEFSGEFYRGRAIGGLGGGIGQSVLFSAAPTSPMVGFRPLNSAGGWSQLKFSVNSRLEFNGAFGSDNPFAADLHAFAAPVGIYNTVLTSNRTEMANFIYRPRSDLVFSGEYRRLHTTQIGSSFTADHVNLMMGVFF